MGALYMAERRPSAVGLVLNLEVLRRPGVSLEVL